MTQAALKVLVEEVHLIPAVLGRCNQLPQILVADEVAQAAKALVAEVAEQATMSHSHILGLVLVALVS
jgi:hypothetical protein